MKAYDMHNALLLVSSMRLTGNSEQLKCFSYPSGKYKPYPRGICHRFLARGELSGWLGNQDVKRKQ